MSVSRLSKFATTALFSSSHTLTWAVKCCSDQSPIQYMEGEELVSVSSLSKFATAASFSSSHTLTWAIKCCSE